jgi:outer membrane protein OmpA-like peptidoglycan-associated protein
MQRDMRSVLAVVLIAGGSHVALADGWVTAEAPAALAVSDAQEGVFRPGVMPAIGAYADRGALALGVRLRAGILRDGPAPADSHFADPGIGGLTTAGLAVRVGARGGWAELVGGGGITGSDLVPAVEAGVGWTFAAGSIDVGPSARYVRVISRDRMAAFGTAELLVVGVDMVFGKQRAPKLVHAPEALRRPPAIVVAPPPPVVMIERDDDDVVDGETGCASDLDGCPLAEAIVIKDDRIVLDERVLFDLDRAKVRSSGRHVIKELARIWRQHPDWQSITVEGHADVRGSDEHNLDLSQRRADRVRDVMVKFGCPADQITTAGYGRSRPRDDGSTEVAHQKNRRVEFVIHRPIARKGEQP